MWNKLLNFPVPVFGNGNGKDKVFIPNFETRNLFWLICSQQSFGKLRIFKALICKSVHLSLSMSICPSYVHLSVYLSICLSICPSVRPFLSLFSFFYTFFYTFSFLSFLSFLFFLSFFSSFFSRLEFPLYVEIALIFLVPEIQDET